MKKYIIFIILSTSLSFLFSCSKKQVTPTLYQIHTYLMEGSHRGSEQTLPLFPGESSINFIENALDSAEQLQHQLMSTFGYQYVRLLDTRTLPFHDNDNLRYFFKLEPDYYLRISFRKGMTQTSVPLNISLFAFPNMENPFQGSAREKLFAAITKAQTSEPIFSMRADVPLSKGIILGKALPGDSTQALFLVLQPKIIRNPSSEENRDAYKEYTDLPGFIYHSYEKLAKVIEAQQKRQREAATLAIGQSEERDNIVPFRELDVKPNVLKRVEPVYPEDARKKGREGMTVLKVTIDESGKVSDTKILRSSGWASLDSSAVTAARGFMFKPGKKDGKAVKVIMTIPFLFRLKK